MSGQRDDIDLTGFGATEHDLTKPDGPDPDDDRDTWLGSWEG